jgi:hypothetical protein
MAGGAHKIKNKTLPLSSKFEQLKLNRAVFFILWQKPAIIVMAADSDPMTNY